MRRTIKILFIFMALILLPFAGRTEESATLLKGAKKISGGENMDAAVPIEFNRDYKLAHHQKKGVFDYFFVQLEPDTVISLEVRTFDKGISWNDKRRVITTEPFANLELQDEKKTVLKTAEIAGKPNSMEKVSFRNRSPVTGRYFVLVGSSQGSMHKDQVVFKLNVSPFVYGDLGRDQDAGSSEATALPIEAARSYTVNSIGGGDNKDMYSFQATKKEWYAVAIHGEDPIKVPFQVNVFSPKRKKMVSYLSGGTEQVVTKSFEIPKNGQYLIEIALTGPLPEKSLYSLELSKVTGPIEMH